MLTDFTVQLASAAHRARPSCRIYYLIHYSGNCFITGFSLASPNLLEKGQAIIGDVTQDAKVRAKHNHESIWNSLYIFVRFAGKLNKIIFTSIRTGHPLLAPVSLKPLL